MDNPSLPSDSRGTTQSAGQTIDEGKGRIFPCESCGADLEFSINQQSLKCPYCGFEKQIEIPADEEVQEQDFHAMLTWLEELRAKDEAPNEDESAQQNEVQCASCGATVVFAGSLTSSECSYCASPIQRDKIHRADDRIPVDGVLPFLVPKETAQQNLRSWVQSRWFAPNEFRRRGVDGKFSGVYLPYWTFDSLTVNRYTGERGENYWDTVGTGKNKRRVRRTRWYPASGTFQRFFDDVLVSATTGLRTDMLEKLEPWPLEQCIPFQQEVLAGHLARTYETTLQDGFTEAKQRIDTAIRVDVQHRIGGDDQRISSINSRYEALTYKHLLLPLWLLAYRYNEKSYQVVINASTGEVQGERPYSWVKILFAVLGTVSAIGAVAFLIFGFQ